MTQDKTPTKAEALKTRAKELLAEKGFYRRSTAQIPADVDKAAEAAVFAALQAQPEAVGKPVAWQKRTPYTNGSFSPWSPCSKENYDRIASTGSDGEFRAEARALVPFPPQAVTVPVGWRLVPEEPTKEMLEAGYKTAVPDGDVFYYPIQREYCVPFWRAMLSPLPPAPQQEAEAEQPMSEPGKATVAEFAAMSDEEVSRWIIEAIDNGFSPWSQRYQKAAFERVARLGHVRPEPFYVVTESGRALVPAPRQGGE